MKKSSLFSLTLFSSFMALALSAQAKPVEHVVIAPTCLLKSAQISHQTLAATQNFELVTVSDQGINALIAARDAQKTPCGGFKDVTAAWNVSSQNPQAFLKHAFAPKMQLLSAKPEYVIKQQVLVNQLLQKINPQNMWTDLTKLTSFPTRSAVSDNGVKAAKWIEEQVNAIAQATGHADVSIYEVKNKEWYYKQPSVVVKLGKSTQPGIVLGAHMDTLPTMFGKMPGADDDGSGTVTLLEVARVLMASGTEFDKPIYFIWYSAEEEGLIGSQSVVDDFVAKKIPVAAVIQLDMTGYAYKNEKTMWLLDDHVNLDLTKYLEKLIGEYVKRPVSYSRCGYACSDHASWDDAGFTASMPMESAFEDDNKDIHSDQDTMDKLSLEHMTDYTKLAVAFAVELAK